MKNMLIIGGSSGLGLSMCLELIKNGNKVIVADCKDFDYCCIPSEFGNNISFVKANLLNKDLSLLKQFINTVDGLIITAGFGRVAKFEQLTETEVNKLMQVDMVAPIRIIKAFYSRIKSDKDFYTAVLGSIAGHITSPLFSVYGAAKSGLCSFIKNINVELIADGYKNRILDVSPGSFKGSSFNGGKSDVSLLKELANEILQKMFDRETLFIPQYDLIYKSVIEKDKNNPIEFGKESFEYKVKNGRLSSKPQVVVGYLSGTFDLFHIGHLNLLRRAKEQCDYLIVGVHESGSWKGKETFIPFDERLEIIRSIEYVDEADKSFDEDSDAWDKYHYDKLFVGSDYQGSNRFKKYEEYFKDKGVEIVYFPYTKGTSSTQLREKLSKK